MKQFLDAALCSHLEYSLFFGLALVLTFQVYLGELILTIKFSLLGHVFLKKRISLLHIVIPLIRLESLKKALLFILNTPLNVLTMFCLSLQLSPHILRKVANPFASYFFNHPHHSILQHEFILIEQSVLAPMKQDINWIRSQRCFDYLSLNQLKALPHSISAYFPNYDHFRSYIRSLWSAISRPSCIFKLWETSSGEHSFEWCGLVLRWRLSSPHEWVS